MAYKAEITIQEKTTVHQVLKRHIGEQNRVDVEELARSLGISRRRLRSIVHEINSDDSDHLILTDTDEGGYWMADTSDAEKAIENYYSEESRAMKLMTKVSAMKHKITRIYGKEALDPNVRLQGSLF